jgi:hypothetical protein
MHPSAAPTDANVPHSVFFIFVMLRAPELFQHESDASAQTNLRTDVIELWERNAVISRTVPA